MNLSCPFFGHALIGKVTNPILLASNGNQCALITTAHAPCTMEPAEWKKCARNPANNGSYGPQAPANAETYPGQGRPCVSANGQSPLEARFTLQEQAKIARAIREEDAESEIERSRR